MYGNDEAIVVGVGRLDQRGVAIIGHQKGRDTKEKVRRNFGMPSPEGYRKAQRLMTLAERYRLPLITLIDTPGAYPVSVLRNEARVKQSPAVLRLWPNSRCQ
jgi:acetyl-CoA carboxylase carboxyl transferase subunit alpha